MSMSNFPKLFIDENISILSNQKKEKIVDIREQLWLEEQRQKPKISKEQILRNREYELDRRTEKIQKDKKVFIRKFVVLYYYYLKLKNINKYKGFYKIKLGPYTMKKYIVFGNTENLNHRLAIYNKRKLLFKIKDMWYNSFNNFEIMKFESEAIFELEGFYNLLIDVINKELKKKEETLDNIDLLNLSLKELV